MLTKRRPQQPSTAPVEIWSWSLDEDYPVFPVGSKPKRLLICPKWAQAPYLIPGHRYLFKVAQGWQVFQVWSEVVAYELSRHLAWTVPPSFIAVDGATGEMGVLIEFFYGYPGDSKPPRFVHGSDILQGFLRAAVYDQKKGRPHWARMNLAISRAHRIRDAITWWARTVRVRRFDWKHRSPPRQLGRPSHEAEPERPNGQWLLYSTTGPASDTSNQTKSLPGHGLRSR